MLQPLQIIAKKSDLPYNIDLNYKRGATIELMMDIAEEYLKKRPIDQAYFFVGVNNLTVKHLSGKVTGVFTHCANLTEKKEQ